MRTNTVFRDTPLKVILITWMMLYADCRPDAAEKVMWPDGADQPRVFNVQSYGAVGDDETDNTEAFTACLKAVIESGGGRMYLPDGVYRGSIVIPPVSKALPSWITIEIV